MLIHENAFQNIVCQMAAILSRGRWVKLYGARAEILPENYVITISAEDLAT